MRQRFEVLIAPHGDRNVHVPCEARLPAHRHREASDERPSLTEGGEVGRHAGEGWTRILSQGGPAGAGQPRSPDYSISRKSTSSGWGWWSHA